MTGMQSYFSDRTITFSYNERQLICIALELYKGWLENDAHDGHETPKEVLTKRYKAVDDLEAKILDLPHKKKNAKHE